MPPVFAHGRLRLYLLKLLDEAPRHGYEVIRLLEERFQGLYAPSAGTVYPRLAKLEAEGLVTHATEGGRKVYSITDAGRAELADRGGELADLEMEIRESVSELAAEIRDDVRSAAGDLRREMKAQAAASGKPAEGTPHDWSTGGPWVDNEAWRTAKEEMRKARQEWKEQARRAKDESRRARQDAQDARRQAKETADRAREHMQQAARRVEEQVREHVAKGDWPSAVRDGLAEIEKEFSRAWGKDFGRFGKGHEAPKDAPDITVERADKPAAGSVWEDAVRDDTPTPPLPDWAHEDTKPGSDPARELDRLLDRFRDGVRDASRDHGVTPSQLTEARARLAATAAHIESLLRGPKK
ncbi:PadR family transcriptional regulator [Streptomyces spiroverticillatus]|uniref:PadR family transcriptional regulator n=1 Tax=Streptomyces finlayi TaxID=67296 RepID=A0A919C6M6_9ACTN|nr:PadR family transcriptional regulator [Streptomyces finlayi]GGZ84867.1 PadR family transcriptional regulator [Streptomyces spiroverticillatus]GHC76604.1 PadR family transcriptional regulator [Streptomyces finlayi]